MLSAQGDYSAAADRLITSPTTLERLTMPQLRQVHGWLLRVGSVESSRKAVWLWEHLQQQGRLLNEISEGLAAAQLHLARLLLREVMGAEGPSVGPVKKMQQKAVAEVAGKGARRKEEKAARRKKQQEEQKKGVAEPTGAAAVVKEHHEGISNAAGAADAAATDGKEDVSSPKAEGATAAAAAAGGRAAAGKSWAAIAATTPEHKPATASSAQASSSTAHSGTTTAAAAAGRGSSSGGAAPLAAAGMTAPVLLIPTTVLNGLPARLRAHPEDSTMKEKVVEAIRALGDARQTFINCDQPAGALEAMSWLTAAKGALHAFETGGYAQHLVMKGTTAAGAGVEGEAAAGGGAGAGGVEVVGSKSGFDMSEVLAQAKGGVELLQALLKELLMNLRGAGPGERNLGFRWTSIVVFSTVQ